MSTAGDKPRPAGTAATPRPAGAGDKPRPPGTPRPAGTEAGLDRSPVALDALRFDERGLIPVIAQDAETREVLMMAWANREALERTLAEGRMVYWSRSREELWRKGDTSGHVQHWDELRVDCDADVIVALIHQEGAACHTGERSCFYRSLAH